MAILNVRNIWTVDRTTSIKWRFFGGFLKTFKLCDAGFKLTLNENVRRFYRRNFYYTAGTREALYYYYYGLTGAYRRRRDAL